MWSRKIRRCLYILRGSIIILALSACVHVYDTPKSPVTGYPSVEKINLKVGLHLTEEFRQAKWERHRMGDTFRILLGETLSQNAEVVARELFSEVVVADSNHALLGTGVGGILTPKVIFVDRTWASTIVGLSVFTIMLEWKLEDLQGNIIWIDSIRGEGIKEQRDEEEQIRATIDDLFHNSFSAISSSPEIREYATMRGR